MNEMSIEPVLVFEFFATPGVYPIEVVYKNGIVNISGPTVAMNVGLDFV